MAWQSLCALHRSGQHNSHNEPNGLAQNWSGDARCGSIADMAAAKRDARSCPDSDHIAAPRLSDTIWISVESPLRNLDQAQVASFFRGEMMPESIRQLVTNRSTR